MSEPALHSTTSTRVTAWLVFGAALGLVVLRAPPLLIEPRFWAEEGAVYYAVAQRAPFFEAFFHRHSAGYLLLSASAPATLAARWLPLEYGPTLTTWAAFAVLATALAVIVFGRSPLWSHPLRRALACAAVLLAPSALGEAWLNSTNSQIYCGLISLCILCEDLRMASPRRLAALLLLLAVCGLSGVYTSFLFFAFAWKLWSERTPGAAWALGVVTLTSLLQFGIFLSLWRVGALDAAKFQPLDWVRSATYTFYQQFLVPLGGRPLVQAFGDTAAVLAALAHGSRDPATLALAGIGLLGALAILIALVDRDPRSPRNGLVIALASLAVLTTLSAKFGRTTGRYALLSGIALLLLVLAHARFEAGAPRWRAVLATGLLGWALLVGGAGYRDDEAFRCPGGCPRWRDELARWCLDPAYAPQIWPVRLPIDGPQWRVKLPPPLLSRACPAIRRDRSAAASRFGSAVSPRRRGRRSSARRASRWSSTTTITHPWPS